MKSIPRTMSPVITIFPSFGLSSTTSQIVLFRCPVHLSYFFLAVPWSRLWCTATLFYAKWALHCCIPEGRVGYVLASSIPGELRVSPHQLHQQYVPRGEITLANTMCANRQIDKVSLCSCSRKMPTAHYVWQITRTSKKKINKICIS